MRKEITWDELEEIEFGEGWLPVSEVEIVSQSRWETFFEQVFKSPEEKYFRVNWSRGSTEYQESSSNPYMVEVEPYEVTVVKYRVKK